MCTLILLRRPGHAWPVVLAANRDEMIARPARPPARHWPDRPEVVAGRDELAHGSWLGINDHGLVAGILNRMGSLGPAPGQRSRGELVLEALDHAEAAAAAAALAALEPRAYRSFNLIIADISDAFWLRHADETGRQPVARQPIPSGLSLIASGELNGSEPARLLRYRPLFAAAAAPEPGNADWQRWEDLLADTTPLPGGEPNSALRFTTDRGYATVSSAMIALPAPGRVGVKPVFRFRTWQPTPSAWQDVAV